MNVSVSVVIPSYNHARYLPKRIDSIRQQTYQNFEIIVLDDCSPDNSREVLTRYAAQEPRIQLVFNEQNSGSTFKQWNKGVGLANGKYIWIAESDDYADPEFLSKLVARLDADSSVGLAYCASWHVDEQNQVLGNDREFFASLDPVLWTQDFTSDGLSLIRKFMSNRNIIPNASAVVLRRSVLQQVGPADATRKINGDWLYWARILAVSKVAYVAEPLNYFRQHTNNVRSSTASNGTDLEETTALLSVMRQYGDPDPTLYKVMIEYLYYKWFEGMAYSKIPLRRHYAIYKNLVQLDKHVNQRILKFMFTNRLSGIRILLGDGIFYPLLGRAKSKPGDSK